MNHVGRWPGGAHLPEHASTSGYLSTPATGDRDSLDGGTSGLSELRNLSRTYGFITSAQRDMHCPDGQDGMERVIDEAA